MKNWGKNLSFAFIILFSVYSACEQFLSGQKLTELACPAVHFDRLMKNKLMWILHI